MTNFVDDKTYGWKDKEDYDDRPYGIAVHSYDLLVYDRVITDPETGEYTIDEVGEYTADSILELIWIVLKHRFEHLLAGEGWRD